MIARKSRVRRRAWRAAAAGAGLIAAALLVSAILYVERPSASLPNTTGAVTQVSASPSSGTPANDVTRSSTASAATVRSTVPRSNVMTTPPATQDGMPCSTAQITAAIQAVQPDLSYLQGQGFTVTNPERAVDYNNDYVAFHPKKCLYEGWSYDGAANMSAFYSTFEGLSLTPGNATVNAKWAPAPVCSLFVPADDPLPSISVQFSAVQTALTKVTGQGYSWPSDRPFINSSEHGVPVTCQPALA
jgi:hypothetical protein